MRRRLTGCCLTLLLFISPAPGLSQTPEGFTALSVRSSASGEASWAKRLWRSELTRTLVAGLALTRIATHFDSPARRDMAAQNWLEFGGVDAGDTYGDGAQLVALSAATWGLGAIAGKPELRQTGGTMIKGLVLDAVLVASLKSAVGRTRPDGSDTRSFPSGHTSGAFTISTILARRHGWKIGIPAFGLATFAGVARMEDDRHYLSDVVAGAALGIAVGQLVTPKPRRDEAGLQVVAGPTKVGLRLKF